MCGILGYLAYSDSRPTAADAVLWRGLVNLVGHRGPDDSSLWHNGRFILGHRRLSIIDLADGQQPMATDEGDLVVSFNGEIYNYVELRQELSSLGHRFRTRSDTEVLLHGYREWGTGLPEKLLGMFAFAIADRRRHELFVARDRFGEKPLVYYEDTQGIAFASEVKVLAALPQVRRELNEDALPAYLCLNYVPGEATMMRGVRRLRPGTWRLWTAEGRSRAAAYWTPPDPRGADLQLPETEAIEQLESLIDQSSKLALRSDVPVGILLSGGIDSSLIARSAARAGRLSAAYCLTFSEASYSEWHKAEQTARALGIPLIEVRLTTDAIEDFFNLVRHADDPLADSSALAVWTLTREVSRQTKVVLSGDGGDELFGGYLTYQATLWHETVTSRPPMPLRRLLARAGKHLPTSEQKVSSSYKLRRFLRAAHLPPSVAHFTWNGTWLPIEARNLLSPGVPRSSAPGVLAGLASAHGLPARPSLRQLQAADVTEYLPNDILAKSDRMSMAHGVEVRSPFLDPSLADLALRLPSAMKVSRSGMTKRILRQIARRAYGLDIASAPKHGFSIPVHAWLRDRGRPIVEDLLSPRSIASIPALDPAAVSSVVAAHMGGRRSFGFEIWGLAVLAAWHRIFIQQPFTVPPGPPPRDVEIKACGAHT
jgi:asparagine synthase (glutamine-hydrolysing)